MDEFKKQIFESLTVNCGIMDETVKERIYVNMVQPYRENEIRLAERLTAGHNYLMSTEPKHLTVEDALEAFGYDRQGLDWYFGKTQDA